MNRFPYSLNALQAFDEIEADALALEALAEEREQAGAAIQKMEGGSLDAARCHLLMAKRLRRIASCLGYMAGRVDRLQLLNEPVRRETNYGKTDYQRSVA
ncbi:hypothetical protein [Microvirga zambiensis]|uniref:hypothetical protein n=1 Tax=Microvirga zambiensis TaxID=1402137 RepID=UPI00191CD2AE|nr:hypothetical protein [Microvirga zambiensis]